MSLIEKPLRASDPQPRLPDPAAVDVDLRWGDVLADWGATPGRPFNMCERAVDRQVSAGRGEAEALCARDRDGKRRVLSYANLQDQAARFAGALDAVGVGRGECVMAVLGPVPELHIAVLGSVRAGAVFGALFAAFGPEPLARRLDLAKARVLVTTAVLYERKIAPLRQRLPALREVWLVDAPPSADDPGLRRFDDVLDAATPAAVAATEAETPALLHFTSGTTGEPKALIHGHRAAVVHGLTGRWALDLGPGDRLWCTADPGWVTGISYGVFAPLLNGATLLQDARDFDPDRWLANLADEAVDVWYTSPTALRMLRRRGMGGAELPALRHIASVGEPLDADTVAWALQAFGRPVHDTYWQSETGGIVIANLPATAIKPGAMGVPLPGCGAAIVRPGELDRTVAAGETGELAIRGDWPGLFVDCPNRPDYRDRVVRSGWYLTGDLVTRDPDGYFWFVGRGDDMIKTAGHMVGPAEVEGALMSHPGVAEAGVVGAPDPVAGEVVWAFVVPRGDAVPDATLRKDILGHARRCLGPAAAPRTVVFRRRLPHTRSGKILRRRLRRLARYIIAGRQSGVSE